MATERETELIEALRGLLYSNDPKARGTAAHIVAEHDMESDPQPVVELEEIPNCDDWGTGEGRYHGRIG